MTGVFEQGIHVRAGQHYRISHRKTIVAYMCEASGRSHVRCTASNKCPKT